MHAAVRRAERPRIRGLLSAALCTLTVAACTAAPATPPAEDFAYQPLWPFTSQQDADGAAAGRHRDAGATALAFTREFLGFNDIDRIVDVTERDGEAWVAVGYQLPDDRTTTAAEVHLARFGSGPDAPWEVVGTRDEVLTLESPPYGSAAGDVIAAGGRITGVDESLHLQVRQVGRDGPLGEFCCLPAGGENQPWSARVTLTEPARPGTLTVVVSTGGHVAEVERFAVTGLRVG